VNPSLRVANPNRSDCLDASWQRNVDVAADRLIASNATISAQDFACTSFAQLPNFANMSKNGLAANESFFLNIKGGFRNAELSGDVDHGRFDLGLSESGGDLFVGVAEFAHGANLLALR